MESKTESASTPEPDSTDKRITCEEVPPATKKKGTDLWIRSASGVVLALIFIALGIGGSRAIVPFIIGVQHIVYFETLQVSNAMAYKALTVGLCILYEGSICLTHSVMGKLGLYDVPVPSLFFWLGVGLLWTGLFIFVHELKQEHFAEHFELLGLTLSMILISGVCFGFYAPLSCRSTVLFFTSLVNVFMNDTMAYVCGRTLGRHKLCKLSPNKTWEGYIGACILTVLLSPLIPEMLLHLSVLKDKAGPKLYMMFYDMNTVHSATDFSRIVARPIKWLYPWMRHVTGFHIYSVLVAGIVSTVGPLQGLIASGFKRSKGVKDFGHTIPGHGGFLDRFDCQMLTGAMSYLVLGFLSHSLIKI